MPQQSTVRKKKHQNFPDIKLAPNYPGLVLVSFLKTPALQFCPNIAYSSNVVFLVFLHIASKQKGEEKGTEERRRKGRKGVGNKEEKPYTTEFALSSVSQRRQIALMKSIFQAKSKCRKHIFSKQGITNPANLALGKKAHQHHLSLSPHIDFTVEGLSAQILRNTDGIIRRRDSTRFSARVSTKVWVDYGKPRSTDEAAQDEQH